MSTPLISADNTWALMAITCGWAAFSIYAEQTWKWASKVSGAIVALIGALVLTNLGIIPTNCVWFDDIVWGYVVPMAIPMLLLSCDIRKIGREAGKILVIFMIGAIGTSVGAILGFKVLGNGSVTKKVTVKAAAFSASAKQAIEAAGGKAEVM